ncbi:MULTISPECIES: hypothetical protein [Rhizobium]|uniref:Micrococcal nuclease (Thermonuclease) n=1 Tax=Rhizobium favelukesii TaxID=348824 RepID=W6RQQ3_9HYPH|nr:MULTISPECIES: hypothetical protein [Rhizobium]MCA0806700.1 hypothetical protein [Rhizobium sp. T1473]MCS0462407.1 hypothetical protein [Rhizobium favelukesii]UFS85204.1 hypothetical protein LPB79_36630 [Rhizobium sp. T136]CDM61188.1 micrococcal nuclease (thermonuclease) [Rhizobium favelukesii]
MARITVWGTYVDMAEWRRNAVDPSTGRRPIADWNLLAERKSELTLPFADNPSWHGVESCHPPRFDSDHQETERDGVTREYSGRNGCEYREDVDRPLRAQPYYFDINSTQDGTMERH